MSLTWGNGVVFKITRKKKLPGKFLLQTKIFYRMVFSGKGVELTHVTAINCKKNTTH
jgi:hypothetical protein